MQYKNDPDHRDFFFKYSFFVKTNWYHDTMICVLWMKKIKLTWLLQIITITACPFFNSVCQELLPIVEFHLDRISKRTRGIFEYMHMKFKSTKEVTNLLSYFYSHWGLKTMNLQIMGNHPGVKMVVL